MHLNKGMKKACVVNLFISNMIIFSNKVNITNNKTKQDPSLQVKSSSPYRIEVTTKNVDKKNTIVQ